MKEIVASWPCHARNVEAICRFVREHLQAHFHNGILSSRLYDVELCISEACTNIMEHGYGWSPEGRVRVKLALNEKGVQIELSDWGAGYDPQSVAEPNLDEPAGRGLGIYLMKRLSNAFHYSSEGGENKLALRFDLRQHAMEVHDGQPVG